MGGKIDQIKGRIKEATGVLTGNEELRAEGKPTRPQARQNKLLKKLRRLPKKPSTTSRMP